MHSHALREALTKMLQHLLQKKTFYSITETFHFCFALGLLCFYSVFNVFIVCLLDLHSVMLRFIIAVAESHKAFCLYKLVHKLYFHQSKRMLIQ